MSLGSDEITGRGIKVTIKYGKGYEETWASFGGLASEVREDICAFFGIDPASVASLTLNDVVVNATNLAHGVGNVAATLGATVIGSTTKSDSQQGEGDVWDAAEAAQREQSAPKAKPYAHLYSEVERASDVDGLKRLWAENQTAFTEDAELLAAWKAKGKSMTVVKGQ